ncbi:hypothetical protein CBM2637_U10007 [Cupriavidus taiwanensis]|nr:hypothetical protein CBM2637_U10007 [Cupriavidus taiwanensis]
MLEAGLDAALNALDVMLWCSAGHIPRRTRRSWDDSRGTADRRYGFAGGPAATQAENAFSALVKREEQAGTLAQGETSLIQARNASLAAYQKGVVRLIEVFHADESLLRTSDARAQAQTESARAAVAAFKALGGGWEPAAALSCNDPCARSS